MNRGIAIQWTAGRALPEIKTFYVGALGADLPANFHKDLQSKSKKLTMRNKQMVLEKRNEEEN